MWLHLVYLVIVAILGGTIGLIATSERVLLWGIPFIGLPCLILMSVRTRRTHSLLALVVIYAVCAERLVFQVSSGGRGLVPVLDIIVGIVAVLLVAHSPSLVLEIVRTRDFALFIAPYLLLTFLLPLAAPFLMGYPARTAAASLGAVMAFAFLMLGFRCSRQKCRDATVPNAFFARYLTAAAVLQAVYALGQFLYNSGVLSSGVWGRLHTWDRAIANVYGIPWISGRSTGLYVNPNVLGLFSAIALVYAAWAPLTTRRRVLIGVPALLTTILSYSRGAILALLVALFTQVLRTLKRPRKMLAQLLVLMVVFISITTGIWASSHVEGLVGAQITERVQSALAVLTKGISADPNLAGRTLFWKRGIALYLCHPLGTLGPPEYIVGTSIDSQWVSVILQGGPLYLLSFIILLLWSLSDNPTGTPEVAFIQALAVLLAVAGLTQHPLSYAPAISVYWFFVGVKLQRTRGCPRCPVASSGDLMSHMRREGQEPERTSLLC